MIWAIDDSDVRIAQGDALEQLALMPSESVHCIVTSPPFWALRDYGTGTWIGGDAGCDHVQGQKGGTGAASAKQVTNGGTQSYQFSGACGKCGAERVDHQIGLEATPEEWCARLVDVFRECRRVLRPDGVFWLEVGDTYCSKARGSDAGWESSRLTNPGGSQKAQAASMRSTGERHRGKDAGYKEKDLVGAPWLLAFALRADGWYLRSDVIEEVELYCPCGCGHVLEERIWRHSQDREMVWRRPNPMPESITDRPTKAHSYVFMLTKRPRYFYDGDAIREPAVNDPKAGGRQSALARGDDRYRETIFKGQDDDHQRRSQRLNATKRRTVRAGVDTKGGGQGTGEMSFPIDSANARSVWTIPTQPTPFAHFATFPQALVERCIKAGTSEHGCCAQCGAPWRRMVDREFVAQEDVSPERGIRRNMDPSNGHEGFPRGSNRSTTVGWMPTCDCGCGVVDPCVVLDPFMGSGTTALVARRLGRHAIGVELNAEYLAIAAGRLQQQSLLGGVA